MDWDNVETNELSDAFIAEVIHYYDSTGSRVRTKLLFSVLNQRGKIQGFLPDDAVDKAKVAVQAIELLHTASLIHDDILDDSISRRGLESLNQKYGARIALITGDVLFSRALTILASLGDGYCVSQLITVLRTMCVGQLRESSWLEVDVIPERDELISTIRQKTGALFGFAARMGAYFSISQQLTADIVEYLNQIAEQNEYFGIAYQLRDDLNDFEYDSNNKTITYPLLYGVSETSELIQQYEIMSGITNGDENEV